MCAVARLVTSQAFAKPFQRTRAQIHIFYAQHPKPHTSLHQEFPPAQSAQWLEQIHTLSYPLDSVVPATEALLLKCSPIFLSFIRPQRMSMKVRCCFCSYHCGRTQGQSPVYLLHRRWSAGYHGADVIRKPSSCGLPGSTMFNRFQ